MALSGHSNRAGRPSPAFQPIDVNAAINIATSKYDGVVFEMEHNAYDIVGFRHALQYMLNRRQLVKGGTLAPAGDADGAHSGQRLREGAVARQAGARHRRLRRGVAAYFERRRSLQRRLRLPLSAHEGPPRLSSGRPARRRSARRGALLGPDAAGILRPRRRLAAQSEGRDFRHPADGRHRRASRRSTTF